MHLNVNSHKCKERVTTEPAVDRGPTLPTLETLRHTRPLGLAAKPGAVKQQWPAMPEAQATATPRGHQGAGKVLTPGENTQPCSRGPHVTLLLLPALMVL